MKFRRKFSSVAHPTEWLLAILPKQLVFAFAFFIVLIQRLQLSVFVLTCLVGQMHAQRPAEQVEPVPAAPDYSDPDAWSIAETPDENRTWRYNRKWIDKRERLDRADVFYIHPTMYFKGSPWNAAYDDPDMERQVDHWPVRHQLSAFSSTCRMFAPRYRQAHLRIFSLGDSLSHVAADIAYSDVRAAFLHYLEQWNNGRPIVLAGHSQGSYHGRTLLQEFFDGTALADQLVAAYLPGMDMYAEEFSDLRLCSGPEEVGCICTWMTYAEGYRPEWLMSKTRLGGPPPMCINPVNWNVDSRWSSLEDHLGSVLPTFRPTKPGVLRCKVSADGVLEVTRPSILGGRVMNRENWHEGDFNLFWFNVEKNVSRRTQIWHSCHSK